MTNIEYTHNPACECRSFGKLVKLFRCEHCLERKIQDVHFYDHDEKGMQEICGDCNDYIISMDI